MTVLHVMKTTDEVRGNELDPVAIDSELFLDLDASSSYWIELCIIARCFSNYSARLYHSMRYSQTLYDPLVHVHRRAMQSGYVSRYENLPGSTLRMSLSQSALSNEYYLFNSVAENSNLRGLIWYSGRITTNEAGRLGFWWRHYDNGGSGAKPSAVLAGSWLYATPLDICPLP